MTAADATSPDGTNRAGDTPPVDAAQPSAETRPLTASPASEHKGDGADGQAGAASTGGPADSGSRSYPKRTLGLHASGTTPRLTSSLPRATGIPQGTAGARRTGPPARTTRVLPAVELETSTEAAAPRTTPPIASEATPTPTAGADASETLPATTAIEASARSEEDETPTLPRIPRIATPTAGPPTAGPPTARQDEAMARVTQAMRALAVVHDDATLATRSTRLLAESERRPITLVAGSQKALRIPASPGLAAKHPRARRALASTVMLAASLSMVLGMLYAAHPAGMHQAAAAPLELVAAQVQKADLRSADRQPESAWGTTAGGQELGLGGGAGPGVKAPGSAGAPVRTPSAPPPPAGPPPQGIGVSPAPFAPWPPANPWMEVPGRSAFVMQPVAGYYSAAFGQCTWWAQYQRRDENLGQLGNARYWAGAAQARGMRVGNRPAPGATVVFQPGTQGAGGGGHVAHVIAVYPGGWFLISEMNFYWNGGGWGRVDYRYAHSGGGVLFIY